MKKKEKWAKPKLVILTRGKPEESVLMACKVAGEAAWQDERGGLSRNRGWGRVQFVFRSRGYVVAN